MKRIALTDNSGAWFDEDKAESFSEGTYWNGRNHISKATGSQWDHEELFRTASGRWILWSWSQWQGSRETYEVVSDDYAASWLSANGHSHADFADRIADMEL